MRKNEVILALACAVTSCPACGLILDFDPPDPTYQDGGIGGDAGPDRLDGSVGDGSVLADARVRDADLRLDGDLALDADGPDADPFDAGMRDGSVLEDCETSPGLCFRFTDESTSPVPVTSYWFTYAAADGLSVEDWRPMSCVGGVLHASRTSTCLMPDAERETGRMMFFYASYTPDGASSVCDGSGCPRPGMEVWAAGSALAPADISQDRGWTRPPLPPSGMTFVFVVNTP